MGQNKKTYRRLYALALTEKISLLWGLLFLILASAASLIYPQLIRWLVDNVLRPQRMDLLLPAVLSIGAVFVIQGVLGAVRYYLFTMSGERIVLKLRQELFEKVLRQEVAFFDSQRTGDLMSRLSSDCTTLQNTVSVNISQGLRNLGQAIGGFAFMYYTSWRLSSLMLLLIPPVAITAVIFGKRVRAYSKQFQNALAEGGIVAEETISGVRTVKAFVQEQNETARYTTALADALAAAQQRTRAIALFMAWAMAAGLSAITFVLWYGGREVITQNLSAGDLTQFLLYLLIVAMGVASLSGLWGDLMAGIGASERVFQILEREPQQAGVLDSTPLDAQNSLAQVQGDLEFRDVTFAYPSRSDVEVLKNINLTIARDQVVALVGASGSGKTTLTSLLARFYEPTAGAIYLDGRDIATLRPAWLREQIGIVSQEPVLISSTIEENIRYAKPGATMDEVISAAKAANVYDFVMRFPEKFQTLVGEKGIQLSGGQKQRVAIARAILKDPRILILDEATSNLDAASEHLVQEALQRLMKGRTTLVIAHRLATIKSANVIFVIDGAKVVQRGTHTELAALEGGVYHNLLRRQFT